jgi:hypothetical protein
MPKVNQSCSWLFDMEQPSEGQLSERTDAALNADPAAGVFADAEYGEGADPEVWHHLVVCAHLQIRELEAAEGRVPSENDRRCRQGARSDNCEGALIECR